MDWLALINSLGGGLSATAIVGLGFAVWRLWSALVKSYEDRIAREKEHSSELLRTIEAVRSLGGG